MSNLVNERVWRRLLLRGKGRNGTVVLENVSPLATYHLEVYNNSSRGVYSLYIDGGNLKIASNSKRTVNYVLYSYVPGIVVFNSIK